MTSDPDPPACLLGEEPQIDSGAIDNAGRVVVATAPVSEDNSDDPRKAGA